MPFKTSHHGIGHRDLAEVIDTLCALPEEDDPHDQGAAAAVKTSAPAGAYLTPRECEVASRLLDGDNNIEIAIALGISRYTVRDHVSEMLRKFGLKRRSELAALLRQVPPSKWIRRRG